MGGCTVISNISVKIKVTADLLYMHLYIIDIVSHSAASTFKCLNSFCILSVAYTLLFRLTYMLGSVCWLLHVGSGEAGNLKLIYVYRKSEKWHDTTKPLSCCWARTFAYLIHVRPIDFPCSVQLRSLLNHTERCVINHIKVEQSHVAPDGQPLWVCTMETSYD